MLSKSLFLNGLRCPRALWLHKHRKDLIPAAPPSKQAQFDEGHAVGRLAHGFFPGGIAVETAYNEFGKSLALTQTAKQANPPAIYEAAASHDQVFIRADILKKNENSEDFWDIVEVKKSSDFHEEHLPDIAVQYHVLQGAGFPMKRAYLLHINTEYVRRDQIDVQGLFRLKDVTHIVLEYLPKVPRFIKEQKAVVGLKAAPLIEIGQQCEKPYDCDFIDHCWQDVPDYSIYDLTRITWKKIAALRAKGVMALEEVPQDFDLTHAQHLQIQTAKTQETIIDKEAVKEQLSRLENPLYFLDFETINPAIPLFEGTRPYQNIPFQFSLRALGSGLHIQFIGNGRDDPRPEIAKLLAENIGPKGSVIVYKAGFEAAILDHLAGANPGYSMQLLNIKDRLWDLLTPYEKRHFVHPKFYGSASIKAVLPALVPSMTYKDMAIAEGSAASLAYLKLISGNFGQEEKEIIRKNLELYCGQDTLAMVKILDVLKSLVGS
ncbi:MAG: DUF2779 domain-containing protein [Elusimicrobia bacterium]|nr:DUF2779 domain-containing protein [Elusimicrobiota bacterium]